MLTTKIQWSGLFQFLKSCQRNSVAEHPSSYSHTTEWKFHPECFKSAERASLTILVASTIAMTPLEEEALKKRLSKICSRYELQGKWELVAKQLNYPLAPIVQTQLILGDKSPRTLFGKRRILESIFRGLKRVESYGQKTSKVKRPTRRRGYDDKGRLRESFLTDIRYWKKPKPEVPYVVNGRTFLPNEYVERHKPHGALAENRTAACWRQDLQDFLISVLGKQEFLKRYCHHR